MDYEEATRAAYRSPARAESYKRYHTAEWSWGRIATCLEQRAIRRLMFHRRWSATDVLLDAPCGTGILGPTLAGLPVLVIASDIAYEMIALAEGEYHAETFGGFVQADITAMPFPAARFECVITVGFMHRVPEQLRHGTLAEIARVCRSTAIISFSLASPAQRLKHQLARLLRSKLAPAPCIIRREQAEAEMRAAGFKIVRRLPIAPLLSAESLYLLEKRAE